MKNNLLNLIMKVKKQNQETKMNHKKLVMIMRNQRIFQMMKMFNLKATMESLMQQLLQRENAKKDSGLAPSKWDGKWINSQEISIFSTTKML